jgi:hypothetical protein
MRAGTEVNLTVRHNLSLESLGIAGLHNKDAIEAEVGIWIKEFQRGYGYGTGRPLFDELLFGRRRPTYVAFDLLIATALICGCSSSARRRFTGRPLGEINSLWITRNMQRWLARGVPI